MDDKIKGPETGKEESKKPDNTNLYTMLGLGGLGAGTGFGAHELAKAHPDHPASKFLLEGVDAGLRGMGNNAIKKGPKTQAGKGFVNTLTQAGRQLNEASKDRGPRRDWSTIDGGKRKPSIGNFASLVGTIGLTILMEELASKAFDTGADHVQNKRQGNNFNRRDNFKPNNDFNRRNDFKKRHNKRADEELNDEEKLAYKEELIYEIIEKTAFELSPGAKRTLVHSFLKPALGVGAFLFPIGALSRGVGRNLYGGMEKIHNDEDLNNRARVIMELPNLPEEDQAKIASAADEVAKRLEQLHNPDGDLLARIQNSLREKIYSNPEGPLARMNDFLSVKDVPSDKQDGVHMVTEWLPRRGVEGMGYAVPLVAAYELTGRNPKRGFEPVQDEPGLPKGKSRIIIEENPDIPKAAGLETFIDELVKEANLLDSLNAQVNQVGESLKEDMSDNSRAENTRNMIVNLLHGKLPISGFESLIPRQDQERPLK